MALSETQPGSNPTPSASTITRHVGLAEPPFGRTDMKKILTCLMIRTDSPCASRPHPARTTIPVNPPQNRVQPQDAMTFTTMAQQLSTPVADLRVPPQQRGVCPLPRLPFRLGQQLRRPPGQRRGPRLRPHRHAPLQGRPRPLRGRHRPGFGGPGQELAGGDELRPRREHHEGPGHPEREPGYQQDLRRLRAYVGGGLCPLRQLPGSGDRWHRA